MLIPFLLVSFYLEKGDVKIITTAIFLIACLTDFFDGYLSRKWSTQSRFGTMLDPIADKLLVTTALCLIITEETWLVLPAVVIICREIFISGLREFLGKTNDVELPVTNLAKWKTASQMVSLILLILTSGSIEGISVTINILYYLGCIVFWLSAGLTLYTGYKYYIAAKRQNLL
jgi:CDP-diacylglycerol--glycerol-3-phosphate 3-phosphatidyltransferase